MMRTYTHCAGAQSGLTMLMVPTSSVARPNDTDSTARMLAVTIYIAASVYKDLSDLSKTHQPTDNVRCEGAIAGRT